jgi:hypothetical protein
MKSLPDLDPNRSAEELFGDIMAYVDAAHALVATRNTVNLAGLDVAVDALCQRVMALEAPTAIEYAVELEHLMERIEALQASMVSLQSKVASAINSLGAQKKANRAYSATPSGKIEE